MITKARAVFIARFVAFILTNGFGNLKQYLVFRTTLWDFKIRVEQTVHNSSIADSNSENGYIQLCREMINTPELIDNFKSNVAYRRVLEHLTPYQGLMYLNEAKKSICFDEKFIAGTMQVDKLGGGEIYKYRNFGTASPTSLRYLKVYCDLVDLFGPLGDLEISEIGCGYGGQSVVINTLSGANSYNYFDLPEVLTLIEKFLSRTNAPENIKLLDGRVPEVVKSDLVISNYAFSELSRELQDRYLECVILRSNSGYITWNDLSYRNLDGYSLQELIEIIPRSAIIRDSPSFDSRTRIIVWGSQKTLEMDSIER